MNIWNKTFQNLVFSDDISARILGLCLLRDRELFYSWAHSPYSWNTKSLNLDWRWDSNIKGGIHFGTRFGWEWDAYTFSYTCEEAKKNLEEFYKQYKQGLL